MSKLDLVQLFCQVDDFWKAFKLEWNKHLLPSERNKRGPDPHLSVSEMLTIVILFHQSNFRTFKHFYFFLKNYHQSDFPKLISYTRFVGLQKGLFIPLFAFVIHQRGEPTGLYFIDSTSIRVCGNKRINKNRIFKGFAKRGKTTIGWFYGFKLHLIINEKGEIMAFQISQGNQSDLKFTDLISRGLKGKLFGDKGYISKALGSVLLDRGLKLFTTLRANMKQKILSLKDRILLRKRSIIETVNDQLKNISQIEHTRHRSSENFMINLLSGLAAYCLQPKKPTLNLEENQMQLIPA